ncbi:MAG: DsbA family protein [Rubrivivax sp.]|jgi:2-hydroxychromene-2-carboxylate isomerase|nr:DsbA family protein [Rubrivivax sp.]
MRRVVFWLDLVSPFAALAFERLPQALEGLSYEVEYRPILFAALLRHWGQKGPAEIEPKRAWTFRHVHWLAHRHGIPLDTPARHPFNPLALLRLAWACAPAGGTPNRRAVEALFRHAWRGGADAEDGDRLAALTAMLAPARDPGADEVKQALRAATDAAIAAGVFGVPAFSLGERAFWGFDALEMLAADLRGDPWFDGPDWAREGAARDGVTRR